ncbi:MAG: HAD family phosphatase [Terracidiphilus sp.]|nr:HAD family phosphatase [Terracidiphilus sp.]
MLQAVIFDYGMVLSGPRAPRAIDAALRVTGLSRARFDELYWAFRGPYDEGLLSGVAYWRCILEKAGVAAPSEMVDELMRLDGRMWCTENTLLLAWQRRLRAAGVKTAILSNMGDAVHAEIERRCAWLALFDVRVWSHQVRCTKPDPRIYRHTLSRLCLEPAKVLFIDDRAENVAAARGLGMHALVFVTVEQLQIDLAASPALGSLSTA